MTPRPARAQQVDAQDEEFVHHLRRAADLVARGEPEPALAPLERARDLRPRDPQVLGLLGQALYRLARFDEAVDAYQRLVDEQPSDASPRVNLGLANLKARRFPQAIRQLEVALELSPEHRKAMGYLGLAWLEQGSPAKARPWFDRSGSPQLVARCDALLAAEAAARAAAQEQPAQPEPVAGASGGDAAGPQAASPQPTAAIPEQVPASAEVHPAPAGPRELPPAGRRTLVPSPGPVFALDGDLLTIRVQDEVLARGEGLLAVRGTVRLAPEMKRFRGRPTEKAFGDGARRMLRATGTGELVFRAPAPLRRLELGAEPGYFAEESVFAFEATVQFENGRVAARGGADLHLVHLRGPGGVVLATAGEVVAIDVTAEAPVRVRSSALVGWTGALTPRVVPIAKGLVGDPGAEAGDAGLVELTGDGRVLIDEGAAA